MDVLKCYVSHIKCDDGSEWQEVLQFRSHFTTLNFLAVRALFPD